MNNIRYRTFISPSFDGGMRLYVFQDLWGQPHEGGDGIKVRTATGFTWRETHEGGSITDQDGIKVADDLIQSIVDKAWERGVRPSFSSPMKNEESALKCHLSDLRKIAFHQLKIKE